MPRNEKGEIIDKVTEENFNSIDLSQTFKEGSKYFVAEQIPSVNEWQKVPVDT